jgi:hypothetical protein
MNKFIKGDLIYNEKFSEYAIFLGASEWDGWIRICLVSTGMRTQVHDHIWEKV